MAYINGNFTLFSPAGTKVKVGGEFQPEFDADTKADKTEMNELLDQKQDKLTAGNGINITNNVISGVSIKLLWENPNPASSFSAQTITLNSSNYDFLIWGVNGYQNNNVVAYLIKKGKSLKAIYVNNDGYYNTNGDSIIRIHRDINYVNDTTYQANTPEARNWLAQNSAANRTGFNDTVIPLYVLGVKL